MTSDAVVEALLWVETILMLEAALFLAFLSGHQYRAGMRRNCRHAAGLALLLGVTAYAARP